MTILDIVESGINLMARVYKGVIKILTLLIKGTFTILYLIIVLWALLLVFEAAYIILVMALSQAHPHLTL